MKASYTYGKDGGGDDSLNHGALVSDSDTVVVAVEKEECERRGKLKGWGYTESGVTNPRALMTAAMTASTPH